jgi:opacity protein-like surface antigen
VACVLTCAAPSSAAADWYVTPFIGNAFRGTTTFVDEYSGKARRKMTVGGSASLIVGVFGVEVDYAWVPRFFQDPDPEVIIVNSRVQTLTGNVIVAAPLSLTRESLRPYAVMGVGTMAAHVEYFRDLLPRVDDNLTAFAVGGGVIGMLGNRTGVRFDVRRFTNLDRDTPSGTTFGPARLHYWRGTVGLTLRY